MDAVSGGTVLLTAFAAGRMIDLGSGTTAVVARKLGRDFFGLEQDENFACLAVHRLDQAVTDRTIQGYHDGVFWERNSSPRPVKSKPSARRGARQARSRIQTG